MAESIKAKAAVIVYHKDIYKLYRREWIELCVSTILQQSLTDFHIFEMDYGDTHTSVFPVQAKNHHFYSEKCVNFVEAMNKLLDKVFRENEFEYCFNVNLDDYYSLNRFEKQKRYIERGFDLVSSNIAYVNEESKVFQWLNLHRYNYKKEFYRDHNVIAHPTVCYSRNFWLNCGGYNINAIPREDLDLWKANMRKMRYFIMSDFLCFYRIHNNQVCSTKKYEPK